jgi:hypothetical protein
MAIYRPPKPRWRTAVLGGAAGMVLGVALGAFLLGGDEPDPIGALRAVRADLSGAAAVLEVFEIEYRESVREGRVVSEAEHRGARDVLARSRARYREARPALAVVNPRTAADLDQAYGRLDALVARPAPAEEVSAAARTLRSLLEGALGNSR